MAGVVLMALKIAFGLIIVIYISFCRTGATRSRFYIIQLAGMVRRTGARCVFSVVELIQWLSEIWKHLLVKYEVIDLCFWLEIVGSYIIYFFEKFLC